MSAAESAAESADPTRMNTDHAAAVIPLSQRRHRGALRAVRGPRDMTPPKRPDTPANARHTPSSDPVAAFAETIEISFLEIKRTLTDPDTAAVYLRTLDVWQRILEGAQANGIIDAGQLHQLRELVDGMRQAPRLV